MPIRILFLADSHLGFDLPTQPQVDRRRRGHDFLANHERALARAKAGDVDLVVHGGDVFHRPRVPPSLVYQAFRSLLEVADTGVPVFVVPGNHERSRIPHARFAIHPNLHIFTEPATFRTNIGGVGLALSGFPYHRRGIRAAFPDVLRETGWEAEEADIRLLCFHHCVEGATVGPSDYTFRGNPDVIRCADLPSDFAAVLSGHIHRYQVLREDLTGRPLETPVFYPGSVERTAFAEKDEEKGFLLLDVEPRGHGGRVVGHEFEGLPARPMLEVHWCPEGENGASWSQDDLEGKIKHTLATTPTDAVLQVRVHGQVPPALLPLLAAANLRSRCPPEMNLRVILVEEGGSLLSGRRRRGGPPHPTSERRSPAVPDPPPFQLDLSLTG
jgi:exonuclease SbcD